jgi:biotin carboxylase
VLTEAAGLGIPVAPQARPESADHVRDFCRVHGLPVVVKSDMSTSGVGVHVAQTEEEAVDLALRRGSVGGGRVPWDQDVIVVQRFVRGTPASVTLACHAGVVLAAFAYVARERDPMPTGPATVIETVNRPDLLRVAGRLIGHLGCTGLLGLDFIIEEGTDTAYFLELNPRPPQTVALDRAAGTDLAAALKAALSGTPAPPAARSEAGKIIALFPNEWLRDSNSPYLVGAHHPVPWDDPKLVAAIISRHAPRARRADGRLAADVLFLMSPNL